MSGPRARTSRGYGLYWIVAIVLALSVAALVTMTGRESRAYDRPRPTAGPLQVQMETVLVEMRDGVKLATDVFRPRLAARFPVLLQRTPYDRREVHASAIDIASHGYIVLVQDTRGRFGSEGEFYPFKYEGQDGYDTVEWAASQWYSDGRVGMWGGSYVGATQMLAAGAAPPHLVAISPYVTASSYYDSWTYQSGVFMQWFASSWTTGLAEDTLRRVAMQREQPPTWVRDLPVEGYRVLDLPSGDSLAPYYRDWVQHEQDDAYWHQWRPSDQYRKMTVAALHSTGWHDIFLKGAIQNYLGMREQAATPEARAAQRLIIGPWAHTGTSLEGKIGDVTFGPSAFVNGDDLAREWSDYVLKAKKNRFASSPPVRLFIMGENVWRDEREFPIARARETRYYLHATRGAATVQGDGALSTSAPLAAAATETPDRFVYDPANPVPTIGGRLCCGVTMSPGPGPQDQRPNEQRDDVLVFSTPPLTQAVEATGFVSVELYASTTAADTDFTALLVDVDPSGYARFLTDGIVRARYRASTTAPEPIVPGEVYKYRIDLWATGNLFQAGHRIRLYLSSSNFPRFNRNPNTGEPMAGATRQVTAQQTIYHDAAHPSALVLPVIPR
jgi:putative CocE/NonD family hydrolase